MTEERISEAGVLTPEQRGLSRTKIAIASRQALASTQRMFAALGGSLLPEGTRIERLFRDIHAMSSHFLLQPEPISDMRGANGGSRNNLPLRIIPERGQVSENGSHPETKQAWDVLHDDVARS